MEFKRERRGTDEQKYISNRHRDENLHNFYLNPDGSVVFRRLRWTRRLPFLCIPFAMRVQRSCRDRLWRRRSVKFIEKTEKYIDES